MSDILLVSAGDDGSFEEFRAHPPVGDQPRPLGRAVSIEQPGHDLAKLVMNACSPRGHFFVRTRQWGCRYAFVLEHPFTHANDWRWDPDGILSEAVALSRLVRDNAYSTQYAARVVEHADGERQVIPFDGYESRQAYRLRSDRDWLDETDAAELTALMVAFDGARELLPARLARALWRCEHLTRERYVDIALPAMVAALEGLIGTSHRQVTKQFVTRVPALAGELGVTGVSGRFCRRMYEARSQGFHGADIDLLRASAQDESVRKVALLQAVLRAAVRRGIEDPAFRAVFADEESIRTRWPVLVRQRYMRWRSTSL